jgi:hypothetical protein
MGITNQLTAGGVIPLHNPITSVAVNITHIMEKRILLLSGQRNAISHTNYYGKGCITDGAFRKH